MSDAVSGYGTLLKMGDGAGPEVFTTIAEVKDITGPGFEAGTLEVTNQSSPGAVREFIIGLLDAGEVTFDLNFLPNHATQDETTGLLGAYLGRLKKNYKLVYPVSPVWTINFAALVTGFEPSAPVDDPLSASATLKVTGLPTFA